MLSLLGHSKHLLPVVLRAATRLAALIILVTGVYADICSQGSNPPASVASSAASSISINRPTGTAVNDLMVAYVTANLNGGSTTYSAPSGWTSITTTTNGTAVSHRIFYKYAVTADLSTTSYSFTSSSSLRLTGGMVQLRGASLSSGIETFTGKTGSSASLSTNSSSTTSSNSWALAFYSSANGNTAISPTSSGLTSLAQSNTMAGPNGISTLMAYKSLSASGTIAALNASGPSTSYAATMVVVNWNSVSGSCGVSPIHHLELVHDGAALTCAPETIVLKACADATCTTQYSGSYTVNLSGPATGWSGGSSQTFSSSPQSLTLWHTTAEIITLAASSTDASNTTTCDGPGTSTSCAVEFFDSGFVVSVPDVIANKPSTSFTISAVRKSDTAQTCAANPAFNNIDTNVNFWGIYNAPATNAAGTAIELRKLGDSAWTTISTLASSAPLVKTALPIHFNTGAQASVELRYADAGKLDLNVDYTSTPASGQTLTMTGVDSFVSVPAGFCIEARTPFISPSATLANCANSSCPIYQKAGREFPLRVRAMAWQIDGESDSAFCSGNSVTPNFRQTNLPLTLTRATDADLTQNGSLGAATITMAAGDTTLSNQSISDVGRFTIASSGTYSDGDGAALPASASAFIGRIIPDNFAISFTAYSAACSTFSYAGSSISPVKAGQPFTLSATIEARNAGGGITSNYSGIYAPLNSIASAISLTPSPSGGGTFNATKNLTFTTGSAPFAPLDAQFLFDAVQAPLSKNMALAVSDNYLDSLGLFGAAGGTVAIVGSETSPAAIAYRLGRLFVDSAYGPEQLALNIPLRAEYFDGTRWASNTLDNCTSYVRTGASLSNYSGNLSVGTPTLATPVAATLLQNGVAASSAPLQLSAPLVDGSVDVQYNISDWLKFDWFNSDGVVDHPIGRAHFGRYRGADRVIYWKEIRD